MAIGRFGSGDGPEDAIWEEMQANSSILSKFGDELRDALAYAKEKEWSIHRMSADEILECYRNRKQTPP